MLFKMMSGSILLVGIFCLSSCGAKPISFGGIVDNGEKPEEGDPETSAPIVFPDFSRILVHSFTLFEGRYELLLPKKYSKNIVEAHQEYFIDSDGQTVLSFEVGDVSCHSTGDYSNRSGLKIMRCSDSDSGTRRIVMAPNGDVMDVYSILETKLLDAILDTMVQK